MSEILETCQWNTIAIGASDTLKSGFDDFQCVVMLPVHQVKDSGHVHACGRERRSRRLRLNWFNYGDASARMSSRAARSGRRTGHLFAGARRDRFGIRKNLVCDIASLQLTFLFI